MFSFRQDETVQDYHGVLVRDPFRWLEDATSADTKAFIARQNARTFEMLKTLKHKPAFEQRMRELWNFPKLFVPLRRGNRYFFLRNEGLQNQPSLYVTEGLAGEPVVLVNTNDWRDDGTVAITMFSPSDDGRYVAYAVSESGSDRQDVRIMDVEKKCQLEDQVRWCKFTNLVWTIDGMGFYYTRFPEPGTVPYEDENNFNQVYFHVLGTSQSEDILIHEWPERKEIHFNIQRSSDGRFLFLYASQGTEMKNQLLYAETKPGSPVKTLIEEQDSFHFVVGVQGNKVILHTDYLASRGRIVVLHLDQPSRSEWREIVPEQVDVMDTVRMIDEELVVLYMKDARHVLRLYDFDGALKRDVELPAIGSVPSLSGNQSGDELFFSFTSFLQPSSIYRYSFVTNTYEVYQDANLPVSADDYVTEQRFFESKDGTRIPMFVSYKKGLQRDGQNPTLLYGYGGFNVSLTPSFSVSAFTWMEQGGIYVVANLRGGSEYGEEWHQAGMRERKQNVFDDFIHAAKYLISEGYTSSKKLAIMGGSNGGLLVSTCMVQGPELYGAVICNVPVTDMLRYHKFTVGHYWIPEWGNAEASKEEFDTLYAYSPLHQVQEGAVYPPILITTADSDDRVVPAHAFKLCATLQSKAASAENVFLRVETNAGHGAGKPTSKIINEQSDIYAFLLDRLRA